MVILTVIILVLMAIDIENTKARDLSQNHILEFWTGFKKHSNISTTRVDNTSTAVNRGNSFLKKSLRNSDTRAKLEKIFYDFRKNRRTIHLHDLEYIKRNSSGEKRKKDYRRHRPGHTHGPRHRSTGTTVNDSVNTAPRLRAGKASVSPSSDDDDSNDTRKNLRPTSAVVDESFLRRSNKSEEDIPDTPLSPYNILRHLKELVIPRFPDVNISVEVLGRTVEYNDIVLLKATGASPKYFRSEKTKYSDDVPDKKIIFIVHGLSVLGFTKLPCLNKLDSFVELLSYYYKHLDQFDIFLIPMANPDGVSMAIAKERWNKNASPQKACPGVALDRNFDVAWNETVDISTCNQYFPGMTPFSEAESTAVRDTFHKFSHRIMAYFHVHVGALNIDTFKGDAVLYPKGYSDLQTDDDKYIDLKGEIEETLRNASFKVLSVTVDTLYNWYGKVAGTSVDFASTVYGIPYAMELVMQLYQDDIMVDNVKERETHLALTEVWRRVIDTIFNNIYKAIAKTNEDQLNKRGVYVDLLKADSFGNSIYPQHGFFDYDLQYNDRNQILQTEKIIPIQSESHVIPTKITIRNPVINSTDSFKNHRHRGHGKNKDSVSKARNKKVSTHIKGRESQNKKVKDRKNDGPNHNGIDRGRNAGDIGRNKKGKVHNKGEDSQNENEENLDYKLVSHVHSTVGPEFYTEGQNSEGSESIVDNPINSDGFALEPRRNRSGKKHKKEYRRHHAGRSRKPQRRPTGRKIKDSVKKSRRRFQQTSLFDESLSDNNNNEPRKFSHLTNEEESLRSKRRYNKSCDSDKLTSQQPMQLAEHNKDKPNVHSSTSTTKSDKSGEEEQDIPLSPYNILRHLKEMVIPRFPNVNISVEVLGRTVEYNDIVLLKATGASPKYFRSEKTKYSDDVPDKKIIFIVHGLSVLGFTKLPCLNKLDSFVELLSYYYKHLDQFDIFLIPMANPDGVSMAMAKERWNKNVSPQKACPGVALDRNFDVAWNETVDVSTCNQYFPGMTPFSEAESTAVRDTFHKFSHRIMAYFHVHVGALNIDTFKGDAVLYPKGYSDMQTDDDKYIDLKGEIEETLRNASFKVLSVAVDTLYNWYGKVAGTSVDFASTVYGIPYAMELVMQLYQDDIMVDNVKERETHLALTEVWRRVIDTIFNNIYKAVAKTNEDQS